MLLELFIVELRHRDTGHRKEGIKTRQTLLLLDFLDLVLPGRHLADIRQCLIDIRLISAIRLLVEMRENVLHHHRNSLRRHHHLFAIDIPDHLIRDILIRLHRLDVVHAERQHISVADSIHDGIAVQLVAKRLRRREEFRILPTARIDRENRCPREAEEMILLEIFHNRRMHIAELASMALIENDDHMLSIDRMPRILLDERRKLLDRRDDDTR